MRHTVLPTAWVVFALFLGLSLQACSDNSLSGLDNGDSASDDDDVVGGDDDDVVDDDDSSSDDDDSSSDDDDAADDDDDSATADDDDSAGDDKPGPWRSTCPPEAVDATAFYGPSGEVEIFIRYDQPEHHEATATLEVPIAGLYDVYETAPAESGASQINESAYLRIRNPTNPSGVPEFPNCDDEYVFLDADNGGGPVPALQLLGTFDLDAGANDVTLYHYCALWELGSCLSFHNGPDDGPSSCDSTNPNSAHMLASGICLVPRE